MVDEKIGWYPIETAPKEAISEQGDTPTILVCNVNGLDSCQITYWDQNAPRKDWTWAIPEGNGHWHKDAFTHWMPPPALPLD